MEFKKSKSSPIQRKADDGVTKSVRGASRVNKCSLPFIHPVQSSPHFASNFTSHSSWNFGQICFSVILQNVELKSPCFGDCLKNDERARGSRQHGKSNQRLVPTASKFKTCLLKWYPWGFETNRIHSSLLILQVKG